MVMLCRFGFIHDERLPDHGKSELEKKQNEKVSSSVVVPVQS